MWQKVKSTIPAALKTPVTMAGNFMRPRSSPDELLGELFHEVQLRGLHADSKTFTDLVPAANRRKILKDYQEQRLQPDFDMELFIRQRFTHLASNSPTYHTVPGTEVREHIRNLWTVLKRQNYTDKGSLMALPYPYVVPGGRFSEQFYWDSYFVMLGLAAHGRYKMIEGMMKNYAFLIRKLGFIPTASRTYFISRSQPPYFSHMVRLLAKKRGKVVIASYLPYLLAEYRFWMKGSKELTGGVTAHRRVVLMPDGTILNRYYDAKQTPRPESYREDVETAEKAPHRRKQKVYLDLRAGAESGWDFSTRWFADYKNLHTIRTTDLIPVDLNCLLYDLERTIADGYDLLLQPLLAKRFREKALRRAAAISRYCWNEEAGFYFDYDHVKDEQSRSEHLAAVYPLFSQIATHDQARAVAAKLKKDFLQSGGLLTTRVDSGQQWDAPNGWAPLQWTAIQALRAYGYESLAATVKARWVAANLTIYSASHKLVEKYNVTNPYTVGGGGEYELQDGFGWTNGVLADLLAEDEAV